MSSGLRRSLILLLSLGAGVARAVVCEPEFSEQSCQELLGSSFKPSQCRREGEREGLYEKGLFSVEDIHEQTVIKMEDYAGKASWRKGGTDGRDGRKRLYV